MSNLFSNQPLKGMKDDFPEDFAKYKWLKAKIDKIASNFLYEEYDSPVLEPINIFAAKSSEELIKEQSYSFTDKGNRDVIMRPEITPSFARMISTIIKEKSKPIRWYSVPKCYRYERPQKGRLREFRQLNFDLIGDNSSLHDLEILHLIDNFMKSFGIPKETYKIKINDRSLINLSTQAAGFSPQEVTAIFKIIDGKNKISEEDFWSSIQEAINDPKKVEFIKEYLGMQSPILFFEKYIRRSEPSFEKFILTYQLIQESELKDSIVFDPSIIRGLDYYTGIVFEVYDQRGEINRALFGGGRYDNLISLFSKESISGIGFGMGLYIFNMFLEELGLGSSELSQSMEKTCHMVLLQESFFPFAKKASDLLRKEGFAVNLYLQIGNMKTTYQKTEQKNYSHIAFIGEDEISSSSFTLKELKTKEIRSYSI